MFQEILRKTVNQLTGNIVDIQPSGNLKIDLPSQNLLNQQREQQQRGKDLKQGVWIGKRPLQLLFGISVTIAEHWAVLVDDHCFSLTTDSGGADGTIEIQEVQDKKYNWFYYNKNKTDINEVRQYVNQINNQRIKYQLLSDNCQLFSLKIAQFASKDTSQSLTSLSGGLGAIASGVLSSVAPKLIEKIPDIAGSLIGGLLGNKKETPVQNDTTTMGNTGGVANTIGQMNQYPSSTMGNMRGNIQTFIGPPQQYQPMYNYDYERALQMRDQRWQQTGQTYQSMYPNQSFMIPQDNINQYQNTGFTQRSYGDVIPTKRGFYNSPYDNQINRKGNIQSFQGINYNLPKQRRQSLQPFLNDYQDFKEQQFDSIGVSQPRKMVKRNQMQQIQQQRELPPVPQNYNRNQYSNMEEEDEED